VDVGVKNNFNNNTADVPCCKDGTPSPSPTQKPGEAPTPTPTAGIGGPPGDGGDGGGNGGGGGVGGGGQVIGLSAASGENTIELLIISTGIVCLLAGAYLAQKNHLAL